jgi:C1A family cysteine protease
MCVADYYGPVNVESVYHVTGLSESQLMAAIAKTPVSVTIDASKLIFHNYTSGVISGTGCGTSLDHAVVAVGYGSDAETGLDYYLVRNSWGKAWGDNGYVKIAREGDGYGVCGIQEISVWSMTN